LIDDEQKQNLIHKLTNYKNAYSNNIIDTKSSHFIVLTKKYYEIKNQIFELMKEADLEAEMIRKKLKK